MVGQHHHVELITSSKQVVWGDNTSFQIRIAQGGSALGKNLSLDFTPKLRKNLVRT